MEYAYYGACAVYRGLTVVMWCLQIFDDLEQQVTDTIDSFDYTSDSFLDNETRSALNNFTSADVGSINITGAHTHTHTHTFTHSHTVAMFVFCAFLFALRQFFSFRVSVLMFSVNNNTCKHTVYTNVVTALSGPNTLQLSGKSWQRMHSVSASQKPLTI